MSLLPRDDQQPGLKEKIKRGLYSLFEDLLFCVGTVADYAMDGICLVWLGILKLVDLIKRS